MIPPAATSLLLADDTLIAREGWRRILGHRYQIVGEAVVIDEVVRQVSIHKPDIVLLDLVWNGDRGHALRVIGDIKQTMPHTKIIACSVSDELLHTAREAGADAALSKGFSYSELVAVIESLVDRHTKHVTTGPAALLDVLSALAIGHTDARRYEELVRQIVRTTLGEHLSAVEVQRSHDDGAEVWDLVALNESVHPFWSMLRVQHSTAHVLFECKNVSKLEADHVKQVIAYLGDPILAIGIIVTRTAPSVGALRAAELHWRRRHEVVLFLDDSDVSSMLRHTVDGQDGTDVVRDAYLRLTRGMQGQGSRARRH